MSVQRHKMLCLQTGLDLRTYLDGVDVTEDCRLASDHDGASYVELILRPHVMDFLQHTELKFSFAEDGDIQIVRIWGQVEIAPRGTP